ncbi:MAG: hypothetical protein KGL39_04835 [Patescibacteria group bacterium]|nr:hypothetical protein [Patescibacteria group bacterium]
MTDEQVLQRVIDTSYRNFHAKGFDYVCLRRSDDWTVKVYFFDGDMRDNPEVVCPHDHRYDFRSVVLAGEVTNLRYRAIPGDMYFAFQFRTPLNGGSGFSQGMPWSLEKIDQRTYQNHEGYVLAAEEIHTIAPKESSVLLSWQYRDRMAVDIPTTTYCPYKTPPSLDGLYEKFSADDVINRLKQIEKLAPGILQEHALHKIAGIPFVAEKAR